VDYCVMKLGGAYDGFEGRQWQVEGETLPYFWTDEDSERNGRIFISDGWR